MPLTVDEKAQLNTKLDELDAQLTAMRQKINVGPSILAITRGLEAQITLSGIMALLCIDATD